MKHARTLLAVAALAMLLVATTSIADDKKPAASLGFDAIKKLAGDWVEVKDGKPTDTVVSRIRVTAGGSAVVETLFPGTGHEMVTMYHMEGPDVVLTHYCVLGNQPKMKLEPGADANKLVFKFAGGSNIKAEKDNHMHQGTINIVDANTVKSEWVRCEDGKACETAGFHMVRKSGAEKKAERN